MSGVTNHLHFECQLLRTRCLPNWGRLACDSDNDNGSRRVRSGVVNHRLWLALRDRLTFGRAYDNSWIVADLRRYAQPPTTGEHQVIGTPGRARTDTGALLGGSPLPLGYGGAEIVPQRRPLIQTFLGIGQAGNRTYQLDISLENYVHLHMQIGELLQPVAVMSCPGPWRPRRRPLSVRRGSLPA